MNFNHCFVPLKLVEAQAFKTLRAWQEKYKDAA